MPNVLNTDHDHLRGIDATTLEKAIAEVISNLTGVTYQCQIKSVTYGGNRMVDGADYQIQVWENIFPGTPEES